MCSCHDSHAADVTCSCSCHQGGFPWFGSRADVRKRTESVHMPPAPWRGPAEIYLGTSKLRDNVRQQYGEAHPLWPVAGWSRGEKALWAAFEAIVALAPLLDEVRARADDHEVGCLASLLETFGAVMQPVAIHGKGGVA